MLQLEFARPIRFRSVRCCREQNVAYLAAIQLLERLSLVVVLGLDPVQELRLICCIVLELVDEPFVNPSLLIFFEIGEANG